jgi:hypothetical protein
MAKYFGLSLVGGIAILAVVAVVSAIWPGRVLADDPPAPFAGGSHQHPELGNGGMNGRIRATPNADGRVLFDVKNGSKGARNDLHLTVIEPKGATATITGTMQPLDATNPASGETVGVEDGGGDGDNQNEVGIGGTQTFVVEFRNKDGELITSPKQVVVQLHWTAFAAPCSIVDPDVVGGVELLSLELSVDEYNPGVVEVEYLTESFAAPSIALGETWGFRLQQGDLLLSLNRGLRFDNLSGISVAAWDEDGVKASDYSSRIQFGTLRIDAYGNLVIPILHRDQTDSKHLAIIVNNASVDRADILSVGGEAFVTFGCSALAGQRFEDMTKIATIVPAE